ncbi:MAG TPA: hypothetical protein VKN82_02245 [Desulfohalobiaceae bacterium]|nr:hypothetical protein [Desulfohalobiaceae bacterium]
MKARILFDPLFFLEYDLRLTVSLEGNGYIRLDGLRILPAHQRRMTMKYIRIYKGLLCMQQDAPRRMRPSLQKLIAQGKIRLEKGQYVKN